MLTSVTWALVALLAASTAGVRGAGRAETIRYVWGYSGHNQTGLSTSFYNYSPDLSLNGVDNGIYSATETGVWVFYNDPNYEGTSCFSAGISQDFNIPESCAGQISSLRYAGRPDGLNDDFINFYAGEAFTGAEFGTDDSAGTVYELDLSVSSLIVSGASQWTLYTGLEFNGARLCVGPTTLLADDDGTVIAYGEYPSVTDLGLPDNSIRSVVKGCFGG